MYNEYLYMYLYEKRWSLTAIEIMNICIQLNTQGSQRICSFDMFKVFCFTVY